ncbi:hypothetical protein B0J14DRAFT_659162 [Halenospora varia]|nr:hypothetical protein B0J14DRAFT_659162 [Halenospora varia]
MSFQQEKSNAIRTVQFLRFHPGFAESNENWEPISTSQMHHGPLNLAQNRWTTPLDPSAEYFATDVIVSRWHVNRNSFSTNQTPQAWMDLGQQVIAVPPIRPTEHIATDLVTSNSETQWESTSTEHTPQATTEETPGTENNRDLTPRDECQLSDCSGYKVLERKITSGEPGREVDYEFLFGEWPIPMPKGLSSFELFLQERITAKPNVSIQASKRTDTTPLAHKTSTYCPSNDQDPNGNPPQSLKRPRIAEQQAGRFNEERQGKRQTMIWNLNS